MLSNFKGDPLDMIPNPLQAEDSALGCTPGSKFENNGISCSLVSNSAVFIMIFGVLGILRIVLSILQLLVPKDSKAGKFLSKISEYFGIPFFINFIFTF